MQNKKGHNKTTQKILQKRQATINQTQQHNKTETHIRTYKT